METVTALPHGQGLWRGTLFGSGSEAEGDHEGLEWGHRHHRPFWGWEKDCGIKGGGVRRNQGVMGV